MFFRALWTPSALRPGPARCSTTALCADSSMNALGQQQCRPQLRWRCTAPASGSHQFSSGKHCSASSRPGAPALYATHFVFPIAVSRASERMRPLCARSCLVFCLWSSPSHAADERAELEGCAEPASRDVAAHAHKCPRPERWEHLDFYCQLLGARLCRSVFPKESSRALFIPDLIQTCRFRPQHRGP